MTIDHHTAAYRYPIVADPSIVAVPAARLFAGDTGSVEREVAAAQASKKGDFTCTPGASAIHYPGSGYWFYEASGSCTRNMARIALGAELDQNGIFRSHFHDIAYNTGYFAQPREYRCGGNCKGLWTYGASIRFTTPLGYYFTHGENGCTVTGKFHHELLCTDRTRQTVKD